MSATLGGKPILGNSEAAWSLTEGVQPASATFDLIPADAEALLSGGLRPTTLILENDGDATLRVEKLYVIQEVASDVPAIRRVMVVDRRWFWTHTQIRLTFNQRRKLGVKYLTAPKNMSGPQTVIPTIGYAPGSLQNQTTPWTGETLLAEIEKWLTLAEEQTTGEKAKFTTAPEAKPQLASMPIENLTIEGDVASALAQVLDYLPGLGVTVRANGDILFFSKTDGQERDMIAAVGPEKVGRGHAKPIDLSLVRPRNVRVLFTREIELLFKFVENTAGVTSDETDPLAMENVLPIPDASLVVSGRTLAKGTWITMQEAFNAWGLCPFIKGPHILTFGDLRRGAIPWNGMAEAIGLLGVADSNADWSARIQTALLHYRRTFRISRRWMDRIFQLRANRVGPMDFTTGARSESPIYSDFSFIGTTRSLYADFAGGHDGSYVNNQPRYSGGGIDDSQEAAPGRVVVVDADQGIIAFDFGRDLPHVYGTALPSQVEMNGDATVPGTRAKTCGPTGDLRDKNRPTMFDVLSDPTRWMQLTGNHVAATILTAQPWPGMFPAPKPGEPPWQQFHVVTVTPAAVAAKSPFAGSGKCLGPTLDILIGPGYETARIAWSDDLASDIKGAFGVPGDTNSPKIRERVVNEGPGGSSGASINDIALAAATRLYHALADRVQGSMVGTMVPSIEPRGWIDSVTHSVDPSGEFSTAVSVPDRVVPMQLEAYLSSSTRRAVLRLANPGG